MASRILVVYYSRTGHTKQLAQRIADAVGADIEAIADRTNRAGVLGYLRSTYEAVRERQADIAPPSHDPAAYPLVIIGTPIWAMSASSPVRSYLRRHRGALRSVAFFCSCGGSGGERAFAQMARDLGGAQPVTTLIVREADLEAARGIAAIDRFVADVQTAEELRREPVTVVPPAPPPAPTPLR